MLEKRTTQGNMKVMQLDVFCFFFFFSSSLLSFPFRMIVVHLNLMYNTIALKLV
jgi:hypothetical protein